MPLSRDSGAARGAAADRGFAHEGDPANGAEDNGEGACTAATVDEFPNAWGECSWLFMCPTIGDWSSRWPDLPNTGGNYLWRAGLIADTGATVTIALSIRSQVR
jgi:hypothetical protein